MLNKIILIIGALSLVACSAGGPTETRQQNLISGLNQDSFVEASESTPQLPLSLEDLLTQVETDSMQRFDLQNLFSAQHRSGGVEIPLYSGEIEFQPDYWLYFFVEDVNGSVFHPVEFEDENTGVLSADVDTSRGHFIGVLIDDRGACSIQHPDIFASRGAMKLLSTVQVWPVRQCGTE